jgi:UDP-N-acetylmuramyl pentapeptide phosphotransferase/UDP-N-acetylglucosamine-1-phosphate transferase
VNPSFEFTYAAVIVVALVALAVYFGRRQVQTLRGLKALENHPPEDRRYHRNQAWLRLASCGLMVVFAGLLAGTYLMGQERRADEMGELRQADRELDPEQKGAAKAWAAYWGVMLLVLLLIVLLTLIDLFAIRRFSLRQYRKIQADRRAMIERQVAVLRSQRNGQEG